MLLDNLIPQKENDEIVQFSKGEEAIGKLQDLFGNFEGEKIYYHPNGLVLRFNGIPDVFKVFANDILVCEIEYGHITIKDWLLWCFLSQ